MVTVGQVYILVSVTVYTSRGEKGRVWVSTLAKFNRTLTGPSSTMSCSRELGRDMQR